MYLSSVRSENLSIDTNNPRGMESKDLVRLLFEVASAERLGILTAVSEGPLKHAQVARRLDMTASETTRHLDRLTSASLVAKNPEGKYEPTNLARLLSAVLPFFRFLTSHREFVLGHDLLDLPPGFVERLGDLSESTFATGVYGVVALQERGLRAAKRRLWIRTDQVFEQALPILEEKARAGADVRVIMPREGFKEAFPDPSVITRYYPVRFLEEVRVFLAVLDDRAGVSFPTPDGKLEMSTMLRLRDPRGYRWAEDLYVHFWREAREL